MTDLDSFDPKKTLKTFELGSGQKGKFYSLPALEAAGFEGISRLPISIRIVLESVLRNCDGILATPANLGALANWEPNAHRSAEIPFVVSRIVLQDFTGVPLLVDLAAMRSAVDRLGKDPKLIEPLVPVDLVVDHSVQVDFAGSDDSYQKNLDIEFERNRERYEFLKWGMNAFDTFDVIPPGIGIVHQVNLEYLARGVLEKDGIYYPDTLVGTDSHTTMINGLGIVGWGVGGIEAEAGMLGQPIYFLTPDVVGVHLKGNLKEGVTATDATLVVTQRLREAKVVGKFVEFFGEGAQILPVPDRATMANMAPEYGATMGFFPIDDQSLNYLRATGRDEEKLKTYENYYRAQNLWGIPKEGEIDYSEVIEIDLDSVEPCVAGPRRPQDRVLVKDLKSSFESAIEEPTSEGGFGKSKDALRTGAVDVEVKGSKTKVGHGSALIASITSCTNTSNPTVMLAAGLLAKNAVEKGLKVEPYVKTSLAPGSRIVTDYLQQAGLQPYLDKLGFQLVGYGCATCIGNSGPLDPEIESAIQENDLIAASVLSGNRNFEARIHQSIKANFLMSPPLVVAFALAGTVDIDLSSEPLGKDENGKPVYLKDIWPSVEDVGQFMNAAMDPKVFKRLYADFEGQNPKWNEVPSSTGNVYEWNEASTYVQEPPFFVNFSLEAPGILEIQKARALGIFGDSVTTDHISPAGAIKPDSPAGAYLKARGIEKAQFNSYGSRRGNDQIMTRGTFANVRIKNLMTPDVEGGVTIHQPSGDQMSIFEAAEIYQDEKRPLVVFAGQEYGAGSSRDWAAKGTSLLGVRAVIAESFERIHRSNLVGMGVAPIEFRPGDSVKSLEITGNETYDILGLDETLQPQQQLTLRINAQDGSRHRDVIVDLRIDTPIEVEYYRHGGILPFVLRKLIAKSNNA